MTGLPCTIVAIDNMFVVPITTTMKAIRLFRPAEDAAITPELRASVARRLANHPGGWSAVSVGTAGLPGVATKLGSEAAAIAGAQEDCRKIDQDCRIIAIGPFSVAPLPPPEKQP